MDDKDKREVPFYIHEAVCDKIERTGKAAIEQLRQSSSEAMSKMDKSNRRMLSALIAVCITLLITAFLFLNAYKVMTKTWVGFIDDHFNETTYTEDGDANGLFVQGDTEDDSSSFER